MQKSLDYTDLLFDQTKTLGEIQREFESIVYDIRNVNTSAKRIDEINNAERYAS